MLKINEKTFQSRLLMGTALYPNLKVLLDSLKASGTEIVTVALRRINLHEDKSEDLLSHLRKENYKLLPNTAGCYTAQDAILTAQMAREALKTNWIKLEVIGDDYTLYPDAEELLQAARELVKKDFIVLPYASDDPVLCQKLADCGCAAVMPLGAPIGSGQGIRNPHNLELIRKKISLPLIIDAGLGTASHIAMAMEMGFDAVLLNTAVAKAQNPVKMAESMKYAIKAGRLAFEAGRIPEKKFASPSSPQNGMMSMIK